MTIKSIGWLHQLAVEITMAPGFLVALDTQLRSHAYRLAGVHLDDGGYMLAPPDDGFAVQFSSGGSDMVGLIQGFLVDPAAFGHPVTLGWRATDTPGQPIHPDQERDDLEVFWTQFPVAELSADRRLDTSAAAAAVTAAFPIEWNLYDWESLSLVLHAHHPFSDEELAELTAAIQQVVRDWNARESEEIDHVGEPDIADDRVKVRYYVDLNLAGANAVIAMINAIGAAPAASAIAHGIVGQFEPFSWTACTPRLQSRRAPCSR